MILVGDVRENLAEIEDGSVRCCVTSPPYWGLRDYGTADWEGGDPECDHRNEKHIRDDATSTLGVPADGGSRRIGDDNSTRQVNSVYRSTCGKCGATRIDKQLGLEETPERYVENMVQVFREVRRVLSDDGTLWLNLGDSYAANRGHQVPDGKWRDVGNSRSMTAAEYDLKPKDLCGIPWRVAFALQADGWWLRSDIIWHKPNPMPESVTDRPTKAHEYIFLLSKSERYFYDADAIAEASISDHPSGNGFKRPQQISRNGRGADEQWTPTATRNRRSVWTATTRPFPEAHFAVFPLTLPMICIQAGSAHGDTVLDPFAGAGTTGVAAQKLAREFIGIELNPEYAAMAERRINGTPLSLELGA